MLSIFSFVLSIKWDILHQFMISTHLSTSEPQKWDFAKHAQPQLKKECAYKKKSVLDYLRARFHAIFFAL